MSWGFFYVHADINNQSITKFPTIPAVYPHKTGGLNVSRYVYHGSFRLVFIKQSEYANLFSTEFYTAALLARKGGINTSVPNDAKVPLKFGCLHVKESGCYHCACWLSALQH